MKNFLITFFLLIAFTGLNAQSELKGLRKVNKQELKAITKEDRTQVDSSIPIYDEKYGRINIMEYARKMKSSEYESLFFIDDDNQVKAIQIVKTGECPELNAPTAKELKEMPQVDCAKLKPLFEEMLQSDQKNRTKGIDLSVDERNQHILKAVLEQCGWPSKDDIGEEGMIGLFLVIQHAPLEMQKEYLVNIKSACDSGEMQPSFYAYLMDRILMREGKAQLYGTQTLVMNGKKMIWPLKDPEHIDQLRKEVQLPGWNEYLEESGLKYPEDLYEI